LEQKVVQDLGANVTLSGGFALQTLTSWEEFIEVKQAKILFGGNDAELVFEVWDIDAFLSTLEDFKISYVHPMKEHSWG
jgi:hypothetical protein